MGRPAGGYDDLWKQTFPDEPPGHIPGASTVASLCKDSGGLVHWAWKLGKEGKDYRQAVDKAANIGTIAHDMMECAIRKKKFVRDGIDPEILEKADKAFSAFLDWADSTDLKPTHPEVTLLSKRYRYGGTLDAMLVNDKLALGDWKTSGAVYPEYLIQLAGYAQLWGENYPNQPITGGFYLLRFSKETGDFHCHHYVDLVDAWEAFKHLRQLYDIMKVLKKRVG